MRASKQDGRGDVVSSRKNDQGNVMSGTSSASYMTSVGLVIKGFCESITDQVSALPLESKIGIVLAIGTFAINWYYRSRQDKREEAIAKASGASVE